MILDPIIEFIASLGFDVSGLPPLVVAVAVVVGLIIGLRVLNWIADAVIQFGCVVLTIIIVLVIVYELVFL